MAKRFDVLVIGATGQQGGALVDNLLAHEHNVRAVTRDPTKQAATKLKERGVDVRKGDLDKPDTIGSAAKGVDVAFLVTTPYEDGPDAETKQGISGVDALVKADVPHIVYASVADADKETGVPHFESKMKVERHLADQKVGYTIVAPVFFRENLIGPAFLDGVRKGKLAMAMPRDRPLQNVSVPELGAFYRDVVEDHEALHRQRINIASDETSPADMARSITAASGRQVEAEVVPLDALREQNEDWALMFEWFDQKGYTADIEGLREAHPNVPWTDFDTWALNQDWAQLKVAQATKA